MPSSPRALVSHFYIQIDGAAVPAALQRDLEQVTVETSLHLPDVATLVLHDPQLRWVDEALLAPGHSLTVSARTLDDERPLFDGEVVELEPEFDHSSQRLVVRAFDRLHRLARGRHARTFQNVDDGEVVRRLAQEAGLNAVVGPTAQVHRHLFQANETNLDFLRGRAAAHGYLLYVQGSTLHCEAPNPDVAVIPLAWGEGLREFRPRLSTIGQVSSVVVRGWDAAQRRAIMGERREGQGAPRIGARQQSGGELTQAAFGMETQHLITDRPVADQPVAERLAQAAADRLAGRFIEAEGLCGGDPALVAGARVQLSAVGERFSGTYLVTSALHTAGAGGYDTRFSISGLHRTTLLSLLGAERAAATATATGLVIGLVSDNDDPERLGRIKVQYPWLSTQHSSDWARVVVPGGGSGRGIQLLPEIGDEVLVGFEQGDIHCPYVIGGLWNGVDAPPDDGAVAGGRVERRVLRSRRGHTIVLDDGDRAAGITITDASGNKIQLNATNNELTIHAVEKLTLRASQISIAGKDSVDIEGGEINLN